MTDADKKLYDKAEELFCQNCKLRTEQCLFAYRKVNGIEDCHKSCGCKEVPAWIDGYRKGIEEMKKEACEFAVLKTTILKLRNCMNCKHRDTRGYSSCKDKGIVLCGHWEMKE